MKKILLMGNQNVGKSALFSRLTGVHVGISNYPGTTVEFKKGEMLFEGKKVEVIDVPGTYSLEASSKAEEVAVEMLKKGDMVVNVLDATNLERNLYLTLQLLERNVPMIVVLNLWDETKHEGIEIDTRKLEKLLGVPVVKTVAVTGFGVSELVDGLGNAKKGSGKFSEKERWSKVGEIVGEVQEVKHRHHTPLERFRDASIKPLTGIPIALVVLGLVFSIIRFIGEGLIQFVFDPLFELYLPFLERLSEIIGPGLLNDILIGRVVSGEIDFVESMGLLSTGLYVPIAMVLPYLFAFYLMLGLLEDSGYLPRLATLIDNVMHMVGLHGLSVIPMILGLGCNVPGALSSRILEDKRQRFIAITLMAIAVPCIAQLAMVAGLLGQFGVTGFGIFFGTLFIVWIVLGVLLNRILKGSSQEIFLEIPPYRVPYYKAVWKKLFMRVKGFIRGAVPYMLLGVVIVNVLYVLGVIEFVGELAAPVIVGILGLPKEAVGALVIGFLRKDVAVGMLLPLALSMKQLIIASVVLTMYFPCIATFTIIFKELGWKDSVKAIGIMVVSTLIVGGILAIIL